MMALGRYPVKAMEAGKHVIQQGMGPHRSAAGTSPEHDGMDDLMGLLGLKSEDRAAKMRERDEQYQWIERARKAGTRSKRDLRLEWRRAYEAGDNKRLGEIESQMSVQQRRQLRREAAQTPDQRMRQRVPKDARPEFDRRFGGQ